MMIRRFHRLGRSILFVGGALAGLLLASDTLSAQPPSVGNARQQSTAQDSSPSLRRYQKERGFRLPIQVDEKSRALIREIHLYVKEQPDAAWKKCATVAPDQQYFEFRAKRDGEYAFTMVTVDTKGRSVPADLRNEPPGIVVVIDTRPPQIELVNLGQSQQGQLIQFDVHDTHLNNARVGLYYQGGDQNFRRLEEVPGRTNVYCVPPQVVSTGVLRATAEDLARNVAVCEIHVQQLPTPDSPAPKREPVATESTPAEESEDRPSVTPKALPKEVITASPTIENGTRTTAPTIENGTRTTAPMPVVPPQVFNIKIEPKVSTPKLPPAQQQQQQQQQQQTLEIQKVDYRPDGSDGPRYVDAPLVPTPMDPVQELAPAQPVVTRKEAPRAQLVNQRKVLFDYQIEDVGSSGVGKVEVWVTRDEGKNWTRHCEDVARKNAVEVQFPEDGVYGVTLVVTNGRGTGHTPPTSGQVPDQLIEVDTAKPAAKITNVETSFQNGATSVLLSWSTQDKNLGEAPVELFYGKTMDGPWLPIAKTLNSEGQHRWTPPVEVGAQAYIRLTVRDLAGNTAAVGVVDPIVLDDLARPRGVIRGIRTEAPKQD